MTAQDILPAQRGSRWQRAAKPGSGGTATQAKTQPAASLEPPVSGPPPSPAQTPAAAVPTQPTAIDHERLAEQSLAQLTTALAEVEGLRLHLTDLEHSRAETQELRARDAERAESLEAQLAERDARILDLGSAAGRNLAALEDLHRLTARQTEWLADAAQLQIERDDLVECTHRLADDLADSHAAVADQERVIAALRAELDSERAQAQAAVRALAEQESANAARLIRTKHEFARQLVAEQEEARHRDQALIAERDSARLEVLTLTGELATAKATATAQASAINTLEKRNAEQKKDNAKLRVRIRELVTAATQRESDAAEPELAAETPADQRTPALQSSAALRLYPWQSEALDAWAAAGNVGTIEAVTGSGKSRVGIAAAAAALAEHRRVLILVPTLNLQAQWQRAFNLELPGATVGLLNGSQKDSLRNRDILIATPISAANQRGTLPKGARGLLIADEAHRYGSPTYSRALDTRYSHRLALSATYERGDAGDAEYLVPYFKGVVFNLGYERALAENVIAPFRIALVGVDFAPGDQETYDEHDAAARKARQDLVKIGVAPEPFAEFIKQVNELARSGAQDKSQRLAKRYLFHFGRRKTLLAETNAKTEALSALAGAVGSASGTLVFTQTKEAAKAAASLFDELGLRTCAIFSGQDEEEHAVGLKEFDAGNLDVLAAPKILDEGIDVPEADLAIIVAASRSRRQMVQRIGRVVRKKTHGGPGRVVILFVRGTVEDPTSGDGSDFLDCILPFAQAVDHMSGARELDRLLPFLESRDQREPYDGLNARRRRLVEEATLALSARISAVGDLDDWGDDEPAEEPEPDLGTS